MPMRTAATGPPHGMSEVASASDAALTANSVRILLIEREHGDDDLHFVADVLRERAAGWFDRRHGRRVSPVRSGGLRAA